MIFGHFDTYTQMFPHEYMVFHTLDNIAVHLFLFQDPFHQMFQMEDLCPLVAMHY